MHFKSTFHWSSIVCAINIAQLKCLFCPSKLSLQAKLQAATTQTPLTHLTHLSPQLQISPVVLDSGIVGSTCTTCTCKRYCQHSDYFKEQFKLKKFLGCAIEEHSYKLLFPFKKLFTVFPACVWNSSL